MSDQQSYALRRVIRANRLLEELGHDDFISALEELAALKAVREAAQDLIDSLDAYPEQLVPINRLSHTCRMLREALAKVEGK